ncbi:helix-turn-helix transcriptional regulator [Galbibacter mesophilus]|uniref:helix-turn-helix transcriptional regulator n=1 Tax=Galbibacter mesophilus TaxID=379069 RepID=UPI00191D6C68|nr:AraC family transcriptional regulator [Galbibacter mesophilus]MCM5661654.1 AraC family transcriptional regulator [Galbibacter mesophilus]
MKDIRMTKESVSSVLYDLQGTLGGVVETSGRDKILRVNNAMAVGEIRAVHLFGRIDALIYDITFLEEINYSITEDDENLLYFLFFHKGYMLQKSAEEKDYITLKEMHHNLFYLEREFEHHAKLPANIRLQYIVINTSLLLQIDDLNKPFLLNSSFREYIEQNMNNGYFHFAGGIDISANKVAESLWASHSSEVLNQLQIHSTVLQILVSQIKYFENVFLSNIDTTRKEYHKEIAAIDNYINLHIDQNFKLKDLQLAAGINATKLQQIINNTYGLSANNYILKLKMDFAASLLLNPSLNISEVSYKIGFNNRSYFSKKFQEYSGSLPSEYRKSHLEK